MTRRSMPSGRGSGSWPRPSGSWTSGSRWGAERSERTPGRKTSRTGDRERAWDTRVGTNSPAHPHAPDGELLPQPPPAPPPGREGPGERSPGRLWGRGEYAAGGRSGPGLGAGGGEPQGGLPPVAGAIESRDEAVVPPCQLGRGTFGRSPDPSDRSAEAGRSGATFRTSCRGLAHAVCRGHLDPTVRPGLDGLDHGLEAPALRGQPILDGHGLRWVDDPLDQALPLEFLQPFRHDAGAQLGRVGAEVAEPRRAVHEDAQHQTGPLLAEQHRRALVPGANASVDRRRPRPRRLYS